MADLKVAWLDTLKDACWAGESVEKKDDRMAAASAALLAHK